MGAKGRIGKIKYSIIKKTKMNKYKKFGLATAFSLIMLYLFVQVLLAGWYSATALVEIPLYRYELGKQMEQVQGMETKHLELNQLPVEIQIVRIFGKKNAKLALAVSQAENGTRQCDRKGGPNKNGTFDWGVFQLNDVHQSKGNLKDCTENIKIAKQIFDRQGWSPWVAYQNGNYKKFLN